VFHPPPIMLPGPNPFVVLNPVPPIMPPGP